MKVLFPITGLLFIVLTSQAQSEMNLSQYRWKNRILLVATPDQSHPDFQKQITAWQKEIVEWEDRDLLVFQIFADKILTPDGQHLSMEVMKQWRQEYELPLHSFEVVLIGKDGSEKLRKSSFLSNSALFATIDQMPMRRAEMRKKNQ